MALRFWIPGKPVPKGRPRFGQGHAYTPIKTRDYERGALVHALNAARKQKWKIPMSGEVSVHLDIHRKLAATANGDVDNYAKAVLDALCPAFFNDRQVTVLFCRKLECEAGGEGVAVEISLDTSEADTM